MDVRTVSPMRLVIRKYAMKTIEGIYDEEHGVKVIIGWCHVAVNWLSDECPMSVRWVTRPSSG